MKKIKILAMALITVLISMMLNVSWAASDFEVNVEETIELQVSNIRYVDAVWRTENSKIATIQSSGKGGISIGSYHNYSYSVVVKGVSKGETTLYLESSTAGVLAMATIKVTNELRSIEFYENNVQIEYGMNYQAQLIYNPQSPDDIGEPVWRSENESIATVDQNGLIKSVSCGTTKITAQVGDKTAELILTVVLPFKDVNEQDWYYNSVKYCYEKGIIKGATETEFRPSAKFSRGMLVTILWRMEGEPKVTNAKEFADVTSGKYYYNAIKWATSKGIVNGYSNGKFGPEDNITREQLAVMLRNYAKYKGKNVSQTADISKYKDSGKTSGYAKTSVQWAIAKGIISGKDNGTRIDPQGTASRAEAASMIYNYCTKIK